MTRQQREDLNYVAGKLSALASVGDDQKMSSVLCDALSTIVNMLNDDEVK